jgi:hypothetical protein
MMALPRLFIGEPLELEAVKKAIVTILRLDAKSEHLECLIVECFRVFQ